MSDLMLDVDQAGELKAAFRRGGWTNGEVKKLSEGDFLTQVRSVLRRTHEIRPLDHVIDLSSSCRLPFDGATVEVHRGSGVVRLEKRVDGVYLDGKKLTLFCSRKQKKGVHGGHDLRKELEACGGNVSAKVLDYFQDNPEMWPEEWKKDVQGNTLYVYFWDDIFRDSDDDLYVRCGCWRDGGVVSCCRWLGDGWGSYDPSASAK